MGVAEAVEAFVLEKIFRQVQNRPFGVLNLDHCALILLTG
jgi:hypothetical protein